MVIDIPMRTALMGLLLRMQRCGLSLSFTALALSLAVGLRAQDQGQPPVTAGRGASGAAPTPQFAPPSNLKDPSGHRPAGRADCDDAGIHASLGRAVLVLPRRRAPANQSERARAWRAGQARRSPGLSVRREAREERRPRDDDDDGPGKRENRQVRASLRANSHVSNA